MYSDQRLQFIVMKILESVHCEPIICLFPPLHSLNFFNVYTLTFKFSFIKGLFIFIFLSVCVLSARVYMCHVHNAVPKESRRGINSLGTGITDVYEVPGGCSEPNHSSLQEQLVCLTTELSLLVRINLKIKHLTLYFTIKVEVWLKIFLASVSKFT